MSKTNLVIYHANCSDGFAAAWAAWTKLGDKDTEYVPWNYGQTFDKPYPVIFTHDNVFIVDFSFPRDDLAELCNHINRVVVLDHHKTAQADLCDEWPDRPENLELVFDMTRSGAQLSWDYFRPYDPTPDLIKYVQDRDLWRKELPETEAINAYISTLDHRFDAWTAAAALIRNRHNDAASFGYAILAKHKQIVADIVKTARPMTFSFEGTELTPISGLAANCTPHFASDVGHELCKKSGTFGATYFTEKNGSVKWSLRSEGDFDVSKIAKYFGGGGHKNAAGFTLKEFGRDTDAGINLWVTRNG